MKFTIFVLTAALGTVSASPNQITLDDAFDMALLSSPGAVSAESSYLQGRAGWWDGIGAITPSVSLSYSGGKYYDRDAFVFNGQTYPITTPATNWSMQATTNYTLLSGISPFNYRGFFTGIASNRSAVAGYKEDISQLHVDVASSFYNVLKTQKLLEVAETLLEASTYHADRAESNLRSGAITRSEYLKTVVQEGNDKISVIEATAAYEVARGSFFSTVGVSKDDDASFIDDDEITIVEIPEFDVALDEALANRPKVVKDYYDYRVAHHSYAQALDSRWPSISATATYNWSDYYAMWDDRVDIDQNDSWYAGLSLTWYPLNAFSSESAIRRAKAAKLLAETNYELSEQSREIELTDAYYEFKKQAEKVIVSKDTYESAQEEHGIVTRLYELGGASAVELSDGQALYVTAANSYFNALYDYKIAQIKWKKAVGELQKDIEH
ncbi:MAG: TolC family protein [bacterium]|nr:TolC family protein [bacterium]